MSLHEQSVGATSEWYTPPYVFEALGVRFDWDVAMPDPVLRWIPADGSIYANSLEFRWEGFIWMNPPFGGRNALIPWLEKFTAHGNGVCLVPDRTSAPWWQTFAPKMHRILFVSPKIKFIGRDGNPGCSPAQGTALMALGDRGTAALRNAARSGLGVLFEPLDA